MFEMNCPGNGRTMLPTFDDSPPNLVMVQTAVDEPVTRPQVSNLLIPLDEYRAEIHVADVLQIIPRGFYDTIRGFACNVCNCVPVSIQLMVGFANPYNATGINSPRPFPATLDPKTGRWVFLGWNPFWASEGPFWSQQFELPLALTNRPLLFWFFAEGESDSFSTPTPDLFRLQIQLMSVRH